MQIFQQLLSFLRIHPPAKAVSTPVEPEKKCKNCGVDLPPNLMVELVVLDRPMQLESSDLCESCAAAYLNKHSILCHACDEPIIPGTPVGGVITAEGSHAYIHLSFECTDTGGSWCGEWGEGELITISELRPDLFSPKAHNSVS